MKYFRFEATLEFQINETTIIDYKPEILNYLFIIYDLVAFIDFKGNPFKNSIEIHIFYENKNSIDIFFAFMYE